MFAREKTSVVGYRVRTGKDWMLISLKKETKGASANLDYFAWENFEPGDTVQVVFLNSGVRIPGVPQFFNIKEMFNLRRGEFSGTFRSRRNRRVQRSGERSEVR